VNLQLKWIIEENAINLRKDVILNKFKQAKNLENKIIKYKKFLLNKKVII
jgi:hypothetical protein